LEHKNWKEKRCSFKVTQRKKRRRREKIGRIKVKLKNTMCGERKEAGEMIFLCNCTNPPLLGPFFLST
jgi:hypothetical protein